MIRPGIFWAEVEVAVASEERLSGAGRLRLSGARGAQAEAQFPETSPKRMAWKSWSSADSVMNGS